MTTSLALVAEVYTEAIEVGDPPKQAVAVTLGCSRSTAGRRIAAARAAGLLPPPDEMKWDKSAKRCPTCGALPSRQCSGYTA